MQRIVIESEDDAWALLQRATAGEDFPDDIQLAFSGWPTLTYDFKGHDWHSTVPTRVMTPLLHVQKDLNRAFARAKYGDGNLHRLKEEERDDLELVVKVEEGSSFFNVELWKQINKVASSITANMNGTQRVIVVLGIALAIASPVMFKMWTSERLEERREERTVQLSVQETERLKVFAAAVGRATIVQETNDEVRATQSRILKAVKPDDKVQIGDVKLSGGQAAAVAQPEAEHAQDVFLEGDFRILGNRTDRSAGFRITVERVSDNLTITADVPLELPHAQRELIEKAEWSKSAVRLHITASMLRGSFSNGLVSSAEKPPPDKTPPNIDN